MEDSKNDNSNQIKDNKNINSKNTFESYLSKKGRNIFVGWQKRYFVCLEGKIIIYTESKENKNVKGFIQIKRISNLKSIDNKTFSIEMDERTYTLRADNKEIKDNWMAKIKYCFTLVKKGSLPENSSSFMENVIFGYILKSDEKNKLKPISKKLGDIILKHGYILNIGDNQSGLNLRKHGIDKLINLNDNKILMNIHYGFMYKRKRLHDTYNKRWFFIFSRGALLNNDNINDNSYLDEKKQKGWIKFDTLYYFKSDKEKTDTEGNANVFDAEIKMDECHKIINYDKDGKYFMNLDYKERIYEFYCESKMERDEWFEVLVNSRTTAKTYKFSITKQPKNVDGLYNLFKKDKGNFYQNINTDLYRVTGDISQISEFNLFEFTAQNLEKFIEAHMDGCLCSLPIKDELLKEYSEYANRLYINIFKFFWDKNYEIMRKEEIIQLGLLMLNYYDTVNKFKVNDINLLKNGTEFAKIYYKSVFPNILYSIENMIKYQIEHKGNKNEDGVYFSDGPKIFFDIFWKIFDLVKNYKHKIIFKLLLKILNMSIYQYCNGINCVLSNRGIIIEDEYLITVSNDSFTINELMNGFIGHLKNLNILTIEEINEEVQMTQIMEVLDKLSFNAIIHLLYEHKEPLEKETDKQNFFEMKLENIIRLSGEIYAKYKSMMNGRVRKIFYKEILRLTLCYYITRLLLIEINKKLKKENIINKIKNDKEIFYETYKDIIGENLTISTLKILDDIIDSLEVDKNFIPTAILTIRQYIGPAFTYSAAKTLVKFRSDLTREEIIECKKQCEEVLNKYEGPQGETSSFFQKLNTKLKKNAKDKFFIKLTESQIKFGNDFKFGNQEVWNEGFNNEDTDLEEEINSIEMSSASVKSCITTNIKEFLNESDDGEEEEEEEEEEKDEGDDEIKKDKEEDSKIDIEGFFQKKSGSSYKKYYYQVKNYGLYWFEDQKKTKPKNKLSLKDATLINPKSQLTEFSLKLKEKNADKEYKFKCNNEQEKYNLVKSITKAINNSKKVINGIQLETIEIKERKKVIRDYLNANNKIQINYIEDQIFEYVKTGKYFLINKERMERQMKINKEKRKKEIEKEKEEEKEKEKQKNMNKQLRLSTMKIKNKKTIKSKIKNFFKIGKKDKNNK